MNFAFSDEQEMLRETARRFLDDKAGSEVVRRLMESDSGFDEEHWSEMAAQGWQAMTIPEEYGGVGFSFMEQAILMEEMGRSVFPSPYLSSVVLGADLVLEAGSEEQKRSILPAVAAGEVRLAVAQLEPNGRWNASGIEMTATRDGEELVLDGTKSFVIDGHNPHTLIGVARTDVGSSGPDGLRLIVVPGDAGGVASRRIETMDQTRKMAEVTFTGTRIPATSVLGSDVLGADGWSALERILTRAVVALAFEQVGGAQQCLDMSVEYAKVRVQFGRPIGSFQAVKHKCAEMLVEIEAAKSAAYYAGWAVTVDDADLGVASALAKSYCSEAYSHAAGENIQIHGGIGFTWEHDAHLYFKRSKADELLFGTPASHRAKLADILGL